MPLTATQDLLLVPPRLAVGGVIALQFGLPKIAGFSPFSAEVARSGVPFPLVIAIGVLVVEVVGGACLALGLLTRLCGTALFVVMLGIALTPRHQSFPWDVTPFMLGGYLFAVVGPGRWSLDGWWRQRSMAPAAMQSREHP